MADLNKIVEDLSSLSVIEAAELSKLLEEKWGVSAAAPVAVTAAPAANVEESAAKSIPVMLALTDNPVLTSRN
jgi:large subunit ribosomal protein L7/L12